MQICLIGPPLLWPHVAHQIPSRHKPWAKERWSSSFFSFFLLSPSHVIHECSLSFLTHQELLLRLAIDYFDKGRSWEAALPLIHTLKESVVLPRHEYTEMANLLVCYLPPPFFFFFFDFSPSVWFKIIIIEEGSDVLWKYHRNGKVLSWILQGRILWKRFSFHSTRQGIHLQVIFILYATHDLFSSEKDCSNSQCLCWTSRGTELERLGDFIKRIQTKFPSAELLKSTDMPPAETINSAGQFLLITPVTPSSEEDMVSDCV